MARTNPVHNLSSVGKPMMISEIGAGAVAGFRDLGRQQPWSENFQANHYAAIADWDRRSNLTARPHTTQHGVCGCGLAASADTVCAAGDRRAWQSGNLQICARRMLAGVWARWCRTGTSRRAGTTKECWTRTTGRSWLSIRCGRCGGLRRCWSGSRV